MKCVCSFARMGWQALKPGWKREFILKVDGWAKDRDANTAYSQTVEPLPFHAMSAYPYRPERTFPAGSQCTNGTEGNTILGRRCD